MIKIHFKFSGLDAFALETEKNLFGDILKELKELKPDIALENYDFYCVEAVANVTDSFGISKESHIQAYPKVSKIKNGAEELTRKKCYEIIKTNNLQKEIHRTYNKNFTNCSTEELKAFINTSLSSTPEHLERHEKCCHNSNENNSNENNDNNENNPKGILKNIHAKVDAILAIFVYMINQTIKANKAESETKSKVVSSDWAGI